MNGAIASPTTLATGDETWTSLGTNVWQINDFAGTAGADPGWDLINANTLNIAATSLDPFVFKIVSLNGSTAGDAANFDNATDYDRVIVHTTNEISGNGISALRIDASEFSNPLAASGSWSLTISGTDLILSYRRAPVIASNPSSVTTLQGQPVNFAVEANGSTLQYQWQKDGADISGATGSTYDMASVTVADAGTYLCVVSNSLGPVASDIAVLTVVPTVVYVSGAFANPIAGQDPDDDGPAMKFGVDSFATIQDGINALTAGGIVNIAAGTYVGSVIAPANVELAGAGQGSVFIQLTNSAPDLCTNAARCTAIAGIVVQGTNVSIHDLTVDGNNAALTNTVGVAVDGSASDVSVSLANCAIRNHEYGVYASGSSAKVKVENCDLRGCSAAAVYAESGAIVDVGNCGSDVTGIGASAGGNNLSGYLSGSAKAAINVSATLVAHKNNFGATTNSPDISSALIGAIDATQSPLVASDLPTVSIECLSSLPAAATNLSQYIERGGAVWATTVSVSSSDSEVVYEGVITRTYTLTDTCGNTTQADQLINVHDAHAPTITGVPSDVTVDCSNVPAPVMPTASDNCDSNAAVGLSEISTQQSSGCAHYNYTVTRTWTATDVSGNSSSATQVITVRPSAPAITAFPSDATFDCVCLVPVPNDGSVVATGGCGSGVTISHAADVVTNVVDASHYQMVRTYTVTDACGNASYRDQVFTMVIAAAPSVSFTGSTDIRVTNALYSITGTAFGGRPIRSVFYSLNNGPFTAAAGSNSWHANLVLAPGTNTVAVYAVDNLTNSSAIANAIVFYSVSNKLTIQVTDWPALTAKSNSGSFFPNLNGRQLEIGRNYTITATPGINLHRFVGWATTADLHVPVYSTNATLTFMMQPGLILVARFENPYFHSKGMWLGLFAEPTVDPRSAGSISLNLPCGSDQSANTFFGTIQVAGYKYAFSRLSGVFDGAGHSHFVVNGPQTLTVDLYLDLVNHSTTITGAVSTVHWTAPLTAYRNLTNHSIVTPARYTAVLPPQAVSPARPNGWGFGTFNLTGAGNVTLAGSTSDNWLISESAKVSQDMKWPLYVQLYNNANGLLWGWLQFTNGNPGVSGTVYWFHPAGVTSGGFAAGFTNTVSIVGSSYNSLQSPTLLNWSGDGFAFLYDHLNRGVTNEVHMSGNLVSVVTTNASFPATNRLYVQISKTTGLVAGSFFNPIRHATDKLKGVLLQNQSNAAGFFVGTNVGAYLMQAQ